MKKENIFISKITERDCVIPKLIFEINFTELPLLIYGATVYATRLYSIANKLKLNISDVVVSSLEGNPSEFMGYKVITISDALMKYERCNVLIAFLNCSFEDILNLEKFLSESKKVEKICYFDLVHDIYYGTLGMEYSFVEKNQIILNELMTSLEDDLSRNVLTAFFNQKISGDARYLKSLVTDNEYFPDFIKLSDGEVFVDCGAYDGDSIESFVKHMSDKKTDMIYAFEPDKYNYANLLKRNFNNSIILQKGCYSEKTTLHFQDGETMSSKIDDSGSSKIDVDTIDNVLHGKKATYIKMDIEGAELAAIEGARNTIISHKPKLAICVYHRVEDLITIPQKIHSFVPEYKLYLRTHSLYSCAVVLYAT